jgi:hypothetical protein
MKMPRLRHLIALAFGALVAVGCAGNDRKESSNKTQTEPGGRTAMDTQPTSTVDHVRFEQGTNNALAGREVGVMNVYPDDDGTLVVQLAINDPATSNSERSELKRGDTITVGAQQFRVVEITPSKGAERGAVTLAPAGRQP